MVGLTAVSAFVSTAPLFSSDAHEAAASTARKNEFQKDVTGASIALSRDPLAFAKREDGKVRRFSALSEVGSSRFGILIVQVSSVSFLGTMRAHASYLSLQH